MQIFPAVMIGGPPNSGKSVLTYNLSQALRQRGILHYVLRATPDGEGDWTSEADQTVVRTILVPRDWTPGFVEHVCQSLVQRHLPLIVDVGGLPKPWQETIFDHCTHAILLTPNEETRLTWQELAARHNLLLLADLHSEWQGTNVIIDTSPILTGTISGPERGKPIGGPTFGALVECIARLFDYDLDQLRRSHLILAPVESTIDLDRLARSFDISFDGERAIWSPHHLPKLLNYLPQGQSIGLYGRGPNWLYAAVALHTYPAAFYQFDVRLGWVEPPKLEPGQPLVDAPLQAHQRLQNDHVELTFSIPAAYLDYDETHRLVIPTPPSNKGLILGGKIPHWLLTALAIAYHDVSLLAVYQPKTGNVVVSSNLPEFTPGQVLV